MFPMAVSWKDGLCFCLKQLPGLPPNLEKKYFVGFWVRSQELFRSCPEAERRYSGYELAFSESVSTGII
jgi:hypothetical protein